MRKLAVAALLAPLLLAGLTAMPTPATAAAETCHGVPATIVGDGTEGLAGTDGPDVIVARDVLGTVDARGGDDLICGFGEAASIYAGGGDDVVDTRGVTRSAVVLLGSGDDTYYGGRASDHVDDASWMSPTVGSDVDEIRTGPGGDYVSSGRWPGVNHDRVYLGSGADSASIQPLQPDGVLDFGSGPPGALYLSLPQGPLAWIVDAASRTVSSDEGVMSWQGRVTRFGATSGDAATVRFLGTPANEFFYVPTNQDDLRLVARMGGGNDDLEVWDRTADGSSYRLGRGDDLLKLGTNGTQVATQNTTVRVDLAQRHLDYGPDTEAAVVGGVEDLVVRGRDVRVTGTAADETFLVNACRVVVRAGVGDDFVQRGGLLLSQCDGTSLLRGGPGRDRLIGHRVSDDVLLGGRGVDVAKAGGGGHDRCQAEVMRGCERVIG